MFSNNVAVTSGGAFYYPNYWPEMENISFVNNSAPYGSDIGSLPIKIQINKTNT